MPIISPSLLAADFLHLEAEVEMINRSEADWLHLDIMDGEFVPNISFGFSVLNAVSRCCRKSMDVHFMVMHPDRFIERTAKLGATMMTVHAETCPHLHRVIQQIHAAGMKAGVALNPSTPLSSVEEILADADMILLMTVNPGFGGQKFIESSIDKIKRLRQMIDSRGLHTLIQVDGGIDANTAPRVIEAGVDVLVAGSFTFKADDPLAAISKLKKL